MDSEWNGHKPFHDTPALFNVTVSSTTLTMLEFSLTVAIVAGDNIFLFTQTPFLTKI